MTIKDNILIFKLATQTEICVALGARLKAQRLAQLLPRRQVAERAGVSEGTLRNLEVKGVATFASVVRVCQALGLLEHLQSLFALSTPRSIDEMIVAARATRQRAPKRKTA